MDVKHETASGGTKKRTSRLAVFQHVVEKEKVKSRKRFRTNRYLEDSSPSESELIIDELEDDYVEPKPKKKNKRHIRLTEEPLNLLCDWNGCLQNFTDYESFNVHLNEHISNADDLTCKWKNCTWLSPSIQLLIQHISYHGYLTKLKNVGQNMLDRNSLPACSLPEEVLIPVSPQGYECEWEYCCNEFFTIYDFFSHMKVHVRNNPTLCKNNEFIDCCWRGCENKVRSQYKLGEHIRVHTKERTLACPTCCALFSTKTKFCDHRKRQLPTDLQSYQCSQCLKLFPTERLLRDHMRSHINHYKCSMCDMTCPRPSVLAKHMRHRHIKAKFFKCKECDKTFVEKHNLRTHLITHDEDGVKHCSLCDFKCRTAVGLKTHMVKNHKQGKNQQYQCHCCKKVFPRGGHLTNHLMKVHNYHWPSGHSRFRYRQDEDGIFRLQTVRYESLEVTQEMIRSESMQTSQQNPQLNYSDIQDVKPKLRLNDAKGSKSVNDNVLITIDDVDEQGNILKSEVVESSQILCDTDNDNDESQDVKRDVKGKFF